MKSTQPTKLLCLKKVQSRREKIYDLYSDKHKLQSQLQSNHFIPKLRSLHNPNFACFLPPLNSKTFKSNLSFAKSPESINPIVNYSALLHLSDLKNQKLNASFRSPNVSGFHALQNPLNSFSTSQLKFDSQKGHKN